MAMPPPPLHLYYYITLNVNLSHYIQHHNCLRYGFENLNIYIHFVAYFIYYNLQHIAHPNYKKKILETQNY